jgi:hypothetical protein
LRLLKGLAGQEPRRKVKELAEDPITIFTKLSQRYPRKTAGEKARDVVVDALRAIPEPLAPLGHATASVLSLFWDPYQDRVEDWNREVAEVVEDLQARVGGIEKLLQNRAFVSAVFQTTRIAASTHQPEKLLMLRHALTNVALNKPADDDLRQVFISLIDQLTVAHILVLDFLRTGFPKGINPWDKADFPRPGSKDYNAAIQLQYPSLKGQDNLIQFIFTDLRNRGLVTIPPNSAYPAVGIAPITNMGIEFLNFVSE